MEFENIEFEDINYLPLIEGDYDIDDELPRELSFIQDIINDNSLSNKTKDKFMRLFGVRYLTNTKFRELTNNCKFIFADDNYIGCYKNINIYDNNKNNMIELNKMLRDNLFEKRKLIVEINNEDNIDENKQIKLKYIQSEIDKLTNEINKLKHNDILKFKQKTKNNLTIEQRNQKKLLIDQKKLLRNQSDLKYKNDVINFNKNETNENANKNILILCADNRSFLNNKWISILKNIKKININFDEYQPYFIGDKIVEKLPYRISGNLKEKYLFEKLEEIKFNIIFIEHCPYYIISKYVENIIYNLLLNNGIVIAPSYNEEILNNFFDIENLEESKYIIYRKKIFK